MSGAIGIDLGSNKCVIAAVRARGVDVLTNDLSNRATPSIVSFGDKQRYIGQSGLSKVNANFRNTVLHPARFVGLTPAYFNLHQETKWLCNRLVTTSDDQIAFQVRYQGQRREFSPQKVIAMLLNHAKEICLMNNIRMSDVVVSVPVYFTDAQRRAMENAAQIADIPLVKLMNEPTAACLSYGLFRNNEFGQQPRIVAFADMGHSKFTVSIAAFTNGKLQVLAHIYDRDLGGRDFDSLIMNYFAASFEKKYGINPMQNVRARMKLATACQKLRKQISANNDATINIEYLIQDYDLNGLFTRQEFEALSEHLLEKISHVCQAAKAMADVSELHSVEIVGGSTRIPCVQEVLCREFGVEQVSKTLNLEEAIVRGCAVQAAMLSALYKVKDFSVQDMVTVPISFTVTPLDMELDVQPDQLFVPKNTFPVTKIFSLKKNGPFKLQLFYEEGIPEGLERHIGTFNVIAPVEEQEYTVKLHVKMNKHGIVNLELAEKIQFYFEEVQQEEQKKQEKKESEEAESVNEQDKMDLEPTEQAAVTKKRTRKIPLEIQTILKGSSPDQVAAFKAEEQKMTTQDTIAKETINKKNEVESFVYEWRDKIQNTYKQFASPEQIQEILQILATTQQWIYGEGQDTLKSVYISKLDQLREKTSPIQQRQYYYSNIDQLTSNYYAIVQQSLALAQSTDEIYSHISQQDRDSIIAKTTEAQDWLSHAIDTIGNTPKLELPTIKFEEIIKRGQTLSEFTGQVMNKPKPAPPKEEAKKEEAQAPSEATAEAEKKQEEDMDLDQQFNKRVKY